MTVMSIKERSHLVSELNTRHIPAPRSRTVLAATAVATVGEERMLPDWQTRRLVDPPEKIWRDNGFDDPEVGATDDADSELDFYAEMRQVVAEEFGLTPGQVRQHQEVIDRYIRESGAGYWTLDHPDSLRSRLGFGSAFSAHREMAFVDADDDEHDLLGAFGMHITTRP